MKPLAKHLVFYDGQCGLCDYVVQFLLKVDKKKQFVFAPLQGTTAAALLKDVSETIKQSDSLILVTHYQELNPKTYIYGRGAFTIAWLLGGWWLLIGWFSFLPPFLYDWGYRLVVLTRHRFFKKVVCKLPDDSEKDRFLP